MADAEPGPAVRRRGPGSRADERHPTRHQLLRAALEVAEESGLAGLSVAAVTRRAGVAKGTFYVHFPDRADFLVALHRTFHDRLLARMREAADGLEPGARRLRTAATAYLDGCLESRGVKAMLREARGAPEILDEIAARNAAATELAAEDFRALGAPDPAHAGRLFVAMAAEAALVELDAAGPVAAAREALWWLAGVGGDGDGDGDGQRSP